MGAAEVEVTSCIIHRAQSQRIAKRIIFSPCQTTGKPSSQSGSVRSSDTNTFMFVTACDSWLDEGIFRCEAKLGVP